MAANPARTRLIGGMVVAVAAVGGLAAWDEQRESAAALQDFGTEQRVLAETVASGLVAQLDTVRRDAELMASDPRAADILRAYYPRWSIHGPPADSILQVPGGGLTLPVPLPDGRWIDVQVPASRLFLPAAAAVHSEESVVDFEPPGTSTLLGVNGQRIDHRALRSALEEGQRELRLSREESAALGLPSRTAMAGLARGEAGSLGSWGVAVTATAERERDREIRARRRLLLALAVAVGLVLGFGGLALRVQRQELQLAHELELSGLARQQDERLQRESRAATMLTLASGMAHELATPLGVIVGRAEQLLPRVASDERSTKNVQLILDETEHINQVTRGFLNLARGGSPALQELEVKTVVEAARSLVEHRFAKASVSLEVRVAEGLPHLRGDARLLEHALVNLLLNACDASPSGTRVSVEALREGPTLLLRIDDEGNGIAPENAARVTEPFFTTKAPGRGTGLGLAVTNEIASSHHGTLKLEPRQPRGTRAELHLPAIS